MDNRSAMPPACVSAVHAFVSADDGISLVQVVRGASRRRYATVDSSRGLLWNFSDENIVKLHRSQQVGGKKLAKYIENACPRISVENNATVNHFGLIKFLKNQDNTFCQIIENLANINNENTIIDMMKNEFAPHFTDERNDLLIYILKERFTRIRNL